MNIYLIRHGEKIDDEKNHESLGLTEKGFKQAELVGKRLKNYNIEKMYASNMKRAIQTAEQIDRFLNIGFDIVPDLREIHMGACETEGWEYLVREYQDFIAEFNKHKSDLRYPPDGECGGDVWTRVSKFIDDYYDISLDMDNTRKLIRLFSEEIVNKLLEMPLKNFLIAE
jgi:probable phosphoglycerate mutase